MTDLKLEGLPKGDYPTVDDYASLFINDIPLLDVRAPVEFKQGAFPNAINVPLMNDAEREAVGIKYKEQGQDAAILLGAELVDLEAQAARKRQWAEFFAEKWGGVLYCFRGGLRSQISQQWLFDETRIKQPRVAGGYKAMRRFLLDSIDRISQEMPIIVLGGRTGSGKTRLLKELNNSIDLEGLANHRGSAFGPTATPQPTQINFENALAIELLKKEAAGCRNLIIEDEARNIGSIGLPQSLFSIMQKAPLVSLEVSESLRNQVSISEYITDTQESFDVHFGKQQGATELANHLLNSLDKIQKRLGGLRYKQTRQELELAIEKWEVSNDISGFVPVVKTLLIDYYDPMYDYQSANKADRIQFKGDYKQVLEHLKTC